MKYFIFILFAVMCLAQWIIPGRMIYDSETILTKGDVFKFRTEPIDPSDPFRGKYVTLRFEADFIDLKDSGKWHPGEVIFVRFTPDSAGFAIAKDVSRTRPESGSYLRTIVTNVNQFQDSNRLQFDLPFNRFYMEESKASQAEQLYWQAQRDSVQVTYGLVSLGAGQAVLQNIFINDKPVIEIINELNENGK